MQNYQSEALPAMPTLTIDEERQSTWSFLDLLDPLLWLGAGVLVLAPTRFTPQTILIGLALLLAPYLLRWIFYGAPSTSTLADLPLVLLFLVMTPISIWITPYFWDKTWPELIRMVWGGAVLLGVVNWAWPVWQVRDGDPAMHYRLPPRLWILTLIYLSIGLLLAVVGLLNMQVVTKIPLIDGLAKQLAQLKVLTFAVDDTFNPNRVAALLVLAAPIPLAFLLASGHTAVRRTGVQLASNPSRATGQVGRALLDLVAQTLWLLVRKVFWLALWLFFAGGLLLTQSRGGLLALALATLFVVALTGRRPDGWLRIVGGIFVIVFLLGMSYFVLDIEYTDLLNGPMTIDTPPDPTKVTNTESLSQRVIIWERALDAIADHPVVGVGLGVFERILYEPYPLAGFIPGDIHHAHNLFLQTALDLGMPGMIGFIALVLIALGSLWRLYRRLPIEGEFSAWTVAILGCFIAFLIYNLLDGLTLGARPAVAMWFLLGLAIGAGKY